MPTLPDITAVWVQRLVEYFAQSQSPRKLRFNDTSEPLWAAATVRSEVHSIKQIDTKKLYALTASYETVHE